MTVQLLREADHGRRHIDSDDLAKCARKRLGQSSDAATKIERSRSRRNPSELPKLVQQ
jgi:hypothetical protein